MFYKSKASATKPLFLVLALLAAALIVVACSDDDDPHKHEATLNGSGFESSAGKPVTVAVVHGEDGDVEASDSGTIADDGTFSVTVHNAMLEGQTYAVDFYVDSDSDGHCDMAEGDEAWRHDLGEVDGDQVVEVSYDAGTMTDTCATFNATEDGHSH